MIVFLKTDPQLIYVKKLELLLEGVLGQERFFMLIEKNHNIEDKVKQVKLLLKYEAEKIVVYSRKERSQACLELGEQARWCRRGPWGVL